MPELLKRGFERLTESPDSLRQRVTDLKLPKEVLSLLVAQVEDTKHELFGVVVREVRGFLEQTNLADELTRVLSSVSLEVRTQVRFVPNPDRIARVEPKVTSQVDAAKESTSTPPPAEPSADARRPEENEK